MQESLRLGIIGSRPREVAVENFAIIHRNLQAC